MSNGDARLTHHSPGQLASSIDAPTPRSRARITGSGRIGIWATILRTLGAATIDRRVDALVVPSRPNWTRAIAINAAISLLFSAVCANASRKGYEWAVPGFYLSIAILFFPAVVRLTLSDVSRSDRVAILIIAALGLFSLRVIRAPQLFTGFDEYLHWATAQNIVERGHLFTPNILLPIGPSFPGLEVVVTAITQVSGVSIFVSAIVCLAIARLLFVGALFLVYERIGGSARVAALACVFYMSCSTFVFFDTSFSYESFALPLMALALLLDLRMRADARHALAPMFLALLIALLALSMTHHITAYALAGIFLGYAGLELVRGGLRAVGLSLGLAALCAILLPIAWSQAMGNPETGYLGPLFENALRDVSQLLQFGSGRKMFTSDDGTLAPLWQRLTTIASVALTCLGLAFGFFRSLSWAGVPFARGRAAKAWTSLLGWTNSRLVLLTLLTLLYPFSIIFRFTRSGWEIGNRIGPFAFLGVGVVLAICVTTFLPVGTRNAWRATGVAVAATVMLIGGIISSEGPRILVPAKYQVSADAASIEPMGIGAALWTKEWLGVGNHFAADRVNRLLLTTFGRQLVSTTLQHGYDAGKVLVAGKLDAEERGTLQKLSIDYLFADLRLTTGMPVLGVYFDGAAADQMLTAPPQVDALLKFNNIDGVSRVFDNGYSIVFDVRGLSGKQ